MCTVLSAVSDRYNVVLVLYLIFHLPAPRERRASGGSSHSKWYDSTWGKSFGQKFSDTEKKSRQESARAGTRVHSSGKEKRELEEMLLVQEIMWKSEEAERKKEIQHLTE